MPQFTPAQLQELATYFGLTPVKPVNPEIIPIRDGNASRLETVWWRAARGPEQVLLSKENHWANAQDYPHLYSHTKPTILYVKYDE